MSVTKNIAGYVDSIGINISQLARKSGVSYKALYASLHGSETRELRADELVAVCRVLRVEPSEFEDGNEQVARHILNGFDRAVVETDEEDPVTIVEITPDGIDTADGYRVRLTPSKD